jgi:O-antigen/teichoic acid export membrane protein
MTRGSGSMAANAVAMFAARLLPPMFAFTVQITVARLAGADVLGAYVNLLAVLMIFQAIAGAGLQFLVSREIAAAPERAAKYARDARAFSLVTGLAGTFLYIGYAAWLLPPGRLAPALVLATTVLPSAWIALQEAIFIGTRTHQCVTIVAVVENTIKATVGVGVLLAGYGLFAVCVGIALARLVALLTGGWLVRRVGVTGSWRIDFDAVLPFLYDIAPFSCLFVLSMVYFRVDVPIVQAIAGERSTGFYGAAIALYGALLLIPDSALAAVYPRLARAFTTSRDEYARATWLIAKVLTVALTCLAVTLIALSDLIVRIVFGPAFQATAPVLRLLALALPVHALNGALGQALQAGGRQRTMLHIVVVGVAVHVAANIVLVRSFGILGAPFAMMLSASVVAIGTLRVLHEHVLPMRVSIRQILGLSALVGPLVVVSLVPAELRLAAGGFGLIWLIAGSLWLRTLDLTDILQMRAALEAQGTGATAA